jgi:hypothetical protein
MWILPRPFHDLDDEPDCASEKSKQQKNVAYDGPKTFRDWSQVSQENGDMIVVARI